MFCRQCGKEISSGSKFCAGCGTPVTAEDSTPSAPEAGASAARVEVPKEKEEVNTEPRKTKRNTRGLLCYLGVWVTGIIFLVIEKRDRLIRFHAMQSLVTFGILNIIWGIASNFGGFVALGWWGLGGFWSPAVIAGTVIFGIFFALWWVLWAVLMYKTYHGRTYRVPVFAKLADKFLAALDKDK